MLGNKEKVMLDIKDLHASVEDIDVFKGFYLNVNAGEVHAIMGPTKR